MGRERVGGLLELLSELFWIAGVEGCAVAISIAQVEHEDARPVGRLPPEFGRLVVQSAPETVVVDSESAEDLRHLSDVTERVGHVTDVHLGTEATRVTVACQQVADVRLGADEEHVGEDVPGSDEDAPRANVVPKRGLGLGSHEQVIVKHDRLPVEHEMFVVAVRGENVEQPVHEVDKSQAELLKGAIPFAVPVGVLDDVDGFHTIP